MATIIKRIQNRLLSNYYATKDFRTSRHIVVFESDDWGSIRMSSKTAWDKLLARGYSVDKRPYERFDILESPDDLMALFDVLRKYKDSRGHHPIITANMLMTNPDFDKIRENGFQHYEYELVENTYNRYYGNNKVLDLMREGLKEGLFMPQSHGREHFNIVRWMKGLQAGDEDLLMAFRYGMCGIAPKDHPEEGNQMMNALYSESNDEQRVIDSIAREGMHLFKELWGFSSKTFVAPCYLWDDRIEKLLADEGVRLIQTARYTKSTGHSPQRFFYSGQRNSYGQAYSIRNCHFEPATYDGGESVKTLLSQIDKVFDFHRIAVISTHRINYVGGINEENRSHNLLVLDEFLKKLLHKYPDVEFKSSDSLIDLFG